MYKRALVAIDRDEASALQVLQAAQERAEVLVVLHVVEPHEIQYSVDPTFVGSMTAALQEQAIETATQRVRSLCAASGVDIAGAEVILGHRAATIHRCAVAQNCDLIIMGSHGWHGWQRILGSTANAVLHGAPVDVLTHRLISEPAN